MEKATQNVQSQSVIYQYLAIFSVNLLTFSYGVTAGWTSSALLTLKSDESPLPSGAITMEEGSWVASLTSVGGFIGNILFGIITNHFGRKIPLVVMTIPTILAWALILYAQNVYFLYASRIINGMVAGGIFILIPLFSTEIASDRVRGILGSILMFAINFGILTIYILGNFCDFFTIPKIVIAVLLVYGILSAFISETPIFLIKQNRMAEAEKSICFYQNIRGNDQLIQSEINKLKIALNKTEKCDKITVRWSDLLRNPARKAMLISLFVTVLNAFCGIAALLCYTGTVFKEAAGSDISPRMQAMSAIIVASIQFFGSFVTTNLVDRAGRKFLYIASTIGTGLGFMILGTYMLLKTLGWHVETFNWVPVVSFSFILFAAAWAIMSLPFVVISEIIPEQFKDFGASLCSSANWGATFIVVKYLPFLTEALGFHGSMFLFGGICLGSAILIILIFPETKGKSYQQIMDMLSH